MHRTEWNALKGFFALGVARASAERAAMLARLLFFTLLLSVFWAIWSATPLGESKLELSAPQLLWYFMITECITLAPGIPFRRVEGDILSGDIAAGLIRPLPYGVAVLAEGLGAALVRLVILAVAGSAYCFYLTGTFVISAGAVLPLIAATVLGCVITLLFSLQLGYVAAWAGSSAPAFWIWQKFLFLAGGLILPLTLYPAPLRGIAEASPFGAILFAPASLVFGASAARIAEIAAAQLFWLVAVGVLTLYIDRAATRRFLTKGV